MIDYLTHAKFLNHDPSILPSSRAGGGGMGTKTCLVLEAQGFGTNKLGADVIGRGCEYFRSSLCWQAILEVSVRKQWQRCRKFISSQYGVPND